jgi:hypothetical protein
MAVLKPRERLVYFRISEDEFRQFTSACEQGGARSVSDLARSAVQRLIADGERRREDRKLEERMQVLEELIAAVSEQLHLLTATQARDGAAAAGNGFRAAVVSAPTNPSGGGE